MYGVSRMASRGHTSCVMVTDSSSSNALSRCNLDRHCKTRSGRPPTRRSKTWPDQCRIRRFGAFRRHRKHERDALCLESRYRSGADLAWARGAGLRCRLRPHWAFDLVRQRRRHNATVGPETAGRSVEREGLGRRSLQRGLLPRWTMGCVGQRRLPGAIVGPGQPP